MVKREFEDGIVGGIEMSRETVRTRTMEKRYPSYLTVDNRENPVVLRTSDRLDPTKLRPRCAYVYYDTLYVTDDRGNIAYMDAELRQVRQPCRLRDISAQRRVGGAAAYHESMDAGHLYAVSLGCHPSMVVEQSISFNSYRGGKSESRECWQNGMFRDLEQDWAMQVRRGDSVNIKAVYTESRDGQPGTYSPEWCYQTTNRTTRETFQYNMPNEAGPKREPTRNERHEERRQRDISRSARQDRLAHHPRMRHRR